MKSTCEERYGVDALDEPDKQYGKAMMTGPDGTRTYINASIGPCTDIIENAYMTLVRRETAEGALALFHEMRKEHPETCMRYMYNDPELGFPPYWEIDPDPKALRRRIHGAEPGHATMYALFKAGLSKEEATELSLPLLEAKE
ncbi:hypothetical protein Q9290_14845 [Oceanimonas sp. CHS3-5]|uniref:hypothetical protein n=1 Tax=Oceanimonas sp. CHS3-5 TaxID=3068186 RepID=UPI00273D7BD5|nr:hypothetical protein [Oceanimonas sp. CHS3-5]MDP5293559.1 hypothetical protein [Oceanimonas sp. CHS3-5]